ncbi:class F sortase [Streptomyces sp. NPDC048639]|uniref:class F sortase n=1 Tax=Streptomyces sp. NPDC048639 TaxID=3365581 RepID=UPI00371FC27E
MFSKKGSGRGAYAPERKKRSPWGLIILALLIGVALIRNGAAQESGPPQPTSESAADSRTAASPAPATSAPQKPPPEPLGASVPSRVVIPAIRINAPLTQVGLDPEGWVASPPATEKNLAGWYKDAVSPGEKGTAVIVGHVDNKTGPVVFYNLGALRKGHKVEVVRQDGRTAVFEIYGIEVFDKQKFPAERVYGDTGKPELRVITCGGGFSKAKGYTGNVVVFARMTDVR